MLIPTIIMGVLAIILLSIGYYKGQNHHIRRTLEMTKGNRAEAAKILEIGERTLYRKIKEYNP